MYFQLLIIVLYVDDESVNLLFDMLIQSLHWERLAIESGINKVWTYDFWFSTNNFRSQLLLYVELRTTLNLLSIESVQKTPIQPN